MDDQYGKIKHELIQTKYELEQRLQESSYNDQNLVQFLTMNEEKDKNKFLKEQITAELHDVNRALLKMEYGLYGLCEETGDPIPFEFLNILPTVRTLKEAERMIQYPFIPHVHMLD